MTTARLHCDCSSVGTILIAVLCLMNINSATAQSLREPVDEEIEVFRLLEDSLLVITSRVWAGDSGSIVVPENRLNAGSRSIRLPVRRLKALSPNNQGPPVFWLSGGPGQSNLHSFVYDYFIDSHDHVMVGYRGVDGDISLDCPEIIEVLETGGDILSDEMLRAVAEGYSQCAERLIGEGIDLDGYTTVDVADDLEAARIGLGYDKIIIVAESFGTRIASVYAQRYPDNIERMVMVGANPPGGMIWDPYENDRLIRRYAAMWRGDEEAVERHPDLEAALRAVEEDFPDTWLLMPIHKGTVRASINAFLFHTETAVQGFDAYVAAAHGDASGLWLISFVGSGIFPTVVNWGDNASKAMSADHVRDMDYLSSLDPDDALFGAPLGAFLWSPGQLSGWPIRSVPDEFHQVQPSEVHTLFLSGSLDLSTPASYVTNSFLPQYTNATHIVISEAGHILDLWRSQPVASKKLVKVFIDTGRIDSSGFRYKPVSFAVDWGFPVLAKLTIGVLFLLVMTIGAGGYFGIRRYRRMRAGTSA